jgi:hypothetical protein
LVRPWRAVSTITYQYGYADIPGTIEYLGGSSCDLGYVEVDATFFFDGQIVGQGLWNTTHISAGHPIPLDVSGESTKKPVRVDVVMTAADCQ